MGLWNQAEHLLLFFPFFLSSCLPFSHLLIFFLLSNFPLFPGNTFRCCLQEIYFICFHISKIIISCPFCVYITFFIYSSHISPCTNFKFVKQNCLKSLKSSFSSHYFFSSSTLLFSLPYGRIVINCAFCICSHKITSTFQIKIYC